MHKSLKNLGLASAAMALVMAPAVAVAQDQTAPDATMDPTAPAQPGTDTMTPPTTPPTAPSDTTTETYPDAVEGTPQGTTTDSATAPTEVPGPQTITEVEQQAAIATWPAETQSYYQSLPQERQQMFWALTDADKVRLSQLPEEQRELAWGQIEAQLTPSQG